MYLLKKYAEIIGYFTLVNLKWSAVNWNILCHRHDVSIHIPSVFLAVVHGNGKGTLIIFIVS